ncbi:uracil-DNA glycosylase family protein (plasmid) [Rhizobium ruizarguesonis]|uniref:Uracil-DNA glycosylase family protein n=1 Tax=Rhizobium ruizarguesonis TaxID=2081791 RepID=A0ACD5EYC3_9HYPH
MSAELDDPDASTMPKAGLSEILALGLSVVFCGLNPALSAVRDGHNFSSPSNRFWRVLHLAGFTPRLLRADEECELLQYGCGLTSAVSRPAKKRKRAREAGLSQRRAHPGKQHTRVCASQTGLSWKAGIRGHQSSSRC